jgi:hypothetical protein
MTITGRKMFVFVLLTSLFTLITGGYIFFNRQNISGSVLIIYMISEITLSGIILSLNTIEKMKRISGSLIDALKEKENDK